MKEAEFKEYERFQVEEEKSREQPSAEPGKKEEIDT